MATEGRDPSLGAQSPAGLREAKTRRVIGVPKRIKRSAFRYATASGGVTAGLRARDLAPRATRFGARWESRPEQFLEQQKLVLLVSREISGPTFSGSMPVSASNERCDNGAQISRAASLGDTKRVLILGPTHGDDDLSAATADRRCPIAGYAVKVDLGALSPCCASRGRVHLYIVPTIRRSIEPTYLGLSGPFVSRGLE
jgi:hypothetical protein